MLSTVLPYALLMRSKVRPILCISRRPRSQTLDGSLMRVLLSMPGGGCILFGLFYGYASWQDPNTLASLLSKLRNNLWRTNFLLVALKVKCFIGNFGLALVT